MGCFHSFDSAPPRYASSCDYKTYSYYSRRKNNTYAANNQDDGYVSNGHYSGEHHGGHHHHHGTHHDNGGYDGGGHHCGGGDSGGGDAGGH